MKIYLVFGVLDRYEEIARAFASKEKADAYAKRRNLYHEIYVSARDRFGTEGEGWERLFKIIKRLEREIDSGFDIWFTFEVEEVEVIE